MEIFKRDSTRFFEAGIFRVCKGLFLLNKCVLSANDAPYADVL